MIEVLALFLRSAVSTVPTKQCNFTAGQGRCQNVSLSLSVAAHKTTVCHPHTMTSSAQPAARAPTPVLITLINHRTTTAGECRAVCINMTLCGCVVQQWAKCGGGAGRLAAVPDVTGGTTKWHLTGSEAGLTNQEILT